MSYDDFLSSKFDKIEDAGFKIDRAELNPVLHEWQKDIVTMQTITLQIPIPTSKPTDGVKAAMEILGK